MPSQLVELVRILTAETARLVLFTNWLSLSVQYVSFIFRVSMVSLAVFKAATPQISFWRYYMYDKSLFCLPVFGAFNPTAFKEPRGFIKVIQWVLSIFAFATTTSVHTELRFEVHCNNSGPANASYSVPVGYPFELDNYGFPVTTCNNSDQSIGLLQGAKAAAEFYVFVGVIVFLYCLAALVMYVFMDDFYRKHNACTVGDFIISCALVLLWLIGSSAWASGLSDVKYYTDLGECGFFEKLSGCTGLNYCRQTMMPNFASLNVSIIFGFLNMLVWGGNLWFLYKETPWHKVQSKPPSMPGQPGGPSETTGRI